MDFGLFLPDASRISYRPISEFLTWRLGWQFWGTNPLPYHVISLLLHASVALLLGLWVAELSGRRLMAWLTGVLFAVFPLHTESVAWLADQWSLWASLFFLLSLLLFSRWWHVPEKVPSWYFAISVALYALAIFSKESTLAMLPILPLSAWLISSGLAKTQWRRITFALLPFAGILILNVVLRFVFLGSIGGYSNLETTPTVHSLNDVWSIVVNRYLALLIAPVNPSVVGIDASVWTLRLFSIAWLLALYILGRAITKWFVLALAWLFLAFLPVFNISLTINTGDLEQNRFFYIPSMAYCLLLAAVLTTLYKYIPRLKRSIMPLMGAVCAALILFFVALSWLNLQPWQAATTKSLEINQQLANLIPPNPNPKAMIWHIKEIPDNFRGAYIFRLGLGSMQLFTRGFGQGVEIGYVPGEQEMEDVTLSAGTLDSFALRYKYNKSTEQFDVNYLTGITSDTDIPMQPEASVNLRVWDFRACEADIIADWHVIDGKASCDESTGLRVTSTNASTMILSSDTDINLQTSGAWFVRLRAAVRYASQSDGTPAIPMKSRWHWRYSGQQWSSDQSRGITARQDNELYTYWTVLGIDDVTAPIEQLRFDLSAGGGTAQIEWIALDFVR